MLRSNFGRMIYTEKIQKAINVATSAHAGQTRKGKPDIPYIIHPLSVALILARADADQDVIVAGILHDTVEDSDGKVALEDIEEGFGEPVATLVRHVTEEDKSLPWAERKKIALSHIYEMSYEALLLKSADVLANLTDLVSDLEIQGGSVWSKFNTDKDSKIEQQIKLVEAFETVWPENPLLSEIKEGVERMKAMQLSQ